MAQPNTPLEPGKQRASNRSLTNGAGGRLIYWMAVGFGAGLVPKAPGTMGTLVAVPLFLLIQHWALWQYLALVVIALIAGIGICGVVSRDTGVKDAPFIVWDEIVGFLVTMTAAPLGLIWLITGFLLFRLFDIWKPWPIKSIDAGVSGGLGIMLDDVVAGLYALAVLQAIQYSIG